MIAANDGVLTVWPESKANIRFSDCDLYGHLNNIQYLKYFLDAREDHLSEYYGMTLSGFAGQGIGWVVGSNQISYLRPAKVNEHVIIKTAILDMSEDQLLVEMQMLDENRKHIKSVMWSRFVHISLKDARRMPHSDELMQFFGKLKIGGYQENDFNKRLADLKEQSRAK